jgi:hypothetical protein
VPRDPSTTWGRLQRGWPPAYPLVQFPNAPLLVAIVASIAARPAAGDAESLLTAASRLGVAIWAYEELVRGDNAFRRVLGAAGLAYVCVAVSGVAG